MTTFDFSPLFRTSVGFDRLASMLNTSSRPDQAGGYPPYNIVSRGENSYQITMAVAGFAENELKLTSELNQLTVVGEKAEEEESEDNHFLYRGIATRSFERRFNLADHVRVTGARLDNGLLHIDLERELPEVMKPRSIEIKSEGNKSLLEGKAEKKQDKAA
ncbi:MAG TPA: Hsp20 family protein [Xanthomonadales bacterium]|nr:Hsp20 family protein [Xanthomonadales bacterium]